MKTYHYENIWRTGSKPYSPFVHMKIAGIYGCELPTNIDKFIGFDTHPSENGDGMGKSPCYS